ncbi:MAG TPA: hypothetical protein VNU68_06390 [Verrucomicrobiae bacterium]|nr:hypothetical protein [Verrucomicrobiae bacterium]
MTRSIGSLPRWPITARASPATGGLEGEEKRGLNPGLSENSNEPRCLLWPPMVAVAFLVFFITAAYAFPPASHHTLRNKRET